MAVAKCLVLFALVAMAFAAEEPERVKKAVLGVTPYASPVAAYPYAAAAAYPYAAYPYAAAAYPYAAAAYPYAYAAYDDGKYYPGKYGYGS